MNNIADRLESITDELKARLDARDRRIEALELKLGRRDVLAPFGSSYGQKAIGHAFVESRQYRDMMARRVWTSDPYEVKELLSSYSDSGGDLIVPQRVPGIIGLPQVELRIRDLLPGGTTKSNEVEYMREESFDNQAAVVQESKEGAEVAKPESSLTFKSEKAAVVTIAHWVPATRQVVADADELASFINNRLLYGLKVVEEQQLLNGTGKDELEGLITQATPFDDGLRGEGDTQLDTLRRAILQVRLSGYPARGIVLHPQDWADIELLKDSELRYIWGSVTEGGVTRSWRVPVVESEAIGEGTFLVGAFGIGAQIWDRQQASVRISEHHGDFFTKNMVAILCEERLALAVYRPSAFVYGSFIEPGS